jgi:hypothetical protein
MRNTSNLASLIAQHFEVFQGKKRASRLLLGCIGAPDALVPLRICIKGVS